MNTRVPVWKISLLTTIEAEEAVTELLGDISGQPVSSYTDVETREVTVAAYLQQKAQPKIGATLRNGVERIRNCGLEIGAGKISVRKIRREDWAESWKRHFKPIEIGGELLIKPSWSRRKPKKGQALVVLDPGLSFGTGQHPTTGFCLLQMAAVLRHRARTSQAARPFSFLDIGSGSGILAIAAAKLGCAPVDAFDFDPDAVRIAQENAQTNEVSENARFSRADVTRLGKRFNKPYDLVCANLISTLLLAARAAILSRLKPEGVLVIAGILEKEFGAVQKAYEKAGLRLIAARTEKEWRSGTFTYRRQKH